MHIEISPDRNISGSDGLTSHIKEMVRNTLAHFADQIMRVEVHLSDANAGKSGQDDKQCMIEARLTGHHPTAVTRAAATLDGAGGKTTSSRAAEAGTSSPAAPETAR